MTRTAIEGGDVLAFDGKRHVLLKGGTLVFEGGTVVSVNHESAGPVDHRIDATGMLVCPGFINAHVHVGIEVMTGLLDPDRDPEREADPRGSRSAAEMLTRRWISPSVDCVSAFPVSTLTPDEQRVSGEFALVQLLKSGSTTILDVLGSGTLWWLGNPPGDIEIFAETVGRLGARAYLSPGYRSHRVCMTPQGVRRYYPVDDGGRGGLEQAVRFIERHHGSYGGRILGMLYPHAVDNCSPDLLRETKQAARSLGVGIQIHTAQTAGEVDAVRQRSGVTPVEHLHDLGFLGPEVGLGHCLLVQGHSRIGGAGDGDLRLVAASGASVAHSPRVWAREGVALESFQRYLDAGITMTIGTDIWPLDIIEEMRLASLIGKIVDGDPMSASAADIISAATLGGAKALQRNDLGRLCAGARADILLVDVARSGRIGPVGDPVKGLIAGGSGADVHTVIIDGRTVVENHRMLGVDEAQLQADAARVGAKLRAALARWDWAGRSESQIFHPAFAHRRAAHPG